MGVAGVGGPSHLSGAVKGARIAPLGKLLAYVWPAVVAAAPVARLLVALPGGSSLVLGSLPGDALPAGVLDGSRIEDGRGVAGLTKHSPSGRPRSEASPSFDLSDSDDLALFLIGSGVLTALLLYTFRRELRRTTFRWPL